MILRPHYSNAAAGGSALCLGVAWGWLIVKSKFQLNCWGFTNILSKWAPEDDQGWVSMYLWCGMRHLNTWPPVRGTVWERVALWEGMCQWGWALRCQRTLSVSFSLRDCWSGGKHPATAPAPGLHTTFPAVRTRDSILLKPKPPNKVFSKLPWSRFLSQ